MDKDAALERLLGEIEGDTLTQPNVLRFKAGRAARGNGSRIASRWAFRAASWSRWNRPASI